LLLCLFLLLALHFWHRLGQHPGPLALHVHTHACHLRWVPVAVRAGCARSRVGTQRRQARLGAIGCSGGGIGG
jgi:hypothetical protein